MAGSDTTDKLHIGFVDALQIDGKGYVGGLLVTNHNGRPLEFQCTTPVKPDRTQEILYGKTLRPWLLGELIGKTLLDRLSIKPQLIVASDPDFLELRNHTSIPVACTTTESEPNARYSDRSTANATTLGGRRLLFHNSHAADQHFIEQKSKLIPGQADLEEPLERVHEALSETVKTVMAR